MVNYGAEQRQITDFNTSRTDHPHVFKVKETISAVHSVNLHPSLLN